MPPLTLYPGDCLDILPTLDAHSIDSVVTDPPYELNFMGREWDRSGIANDVALWRAVYRVLKPGAYLCAFGGTRTVHRMTCAIEDAGFEIRDQFQWLYGSGFPKNRAVALKPAHEPIVLARKPLIGTVSGNMAAWGTGALDIDGCRVGTGEDRASGGLALKASMFQAGVQLARPTAGRWPPNVLLTHSATCNGHCAPDCPVAALDAQANVHSAGAIRGANQATQTQEGGLFGLGNHPGNGARYGDLGGASRFFPLLNWDAALDVPWYYCAKASRSERNAGCRGLHAQPSARYERMAGTPDHSPKQDTPEANSHPTVKPVALMRWLVRLVTPPGGTVLDPFLGSGSTGVACVNTGRAFVGIERDPGYFAIAQARVTAASAQPALPIAS